MSELHSISILFVAFLCVFAQASFNGLRDLVGAQIDLLPALVVYTSLRGGLVTLTLLSLLGGLWFDSLSINPAGVSVLPLFLCGVSIYRTRELLLREQAYAQFVLGLAASALTPLLSVLLLLQLGQKPLLGWHSLWQWLVMALGGAIFTPIFFKLFGRIERAFSYQTLPETSFRSDREIIRGHGRP